MPYNSDISIELSQQIGNLFYAIAKADTALSFEEYTKLSNLLENRWSAYSEESRVEIMSQFHKLQRQNKSAHSCFNEFLEYLQNHPEVFSPNIKELLITSCNDIAYAFSKINKSELNLMAKLSLAFKNARL